METTSNQDHHQVLEQLATNQCHCERLVTELPSTLSWIQRRAHALLVADTPGSVRAFPYMKSQIIDAAMRLAKLCPTWMDMSLTDTMSFGKWIKSNIESIGFINLYQFREMPFCGAKLEMRTAHLYVGGVKQKEIRLNTTWIRSAEPLYSFVTEKPRRPDWPANLGEADFRLIEGVIESCKSFPSGAMVEPEEVWLDTGFVVTLVSTQLAEVDWWLESHEVPLAACETSALLNELECGLESVDHLIGRRITVRALLVLRAILVAMLCWDALDISPFIGTELGSQPVLFR